MSIEANLASIAKSLETIAAVMSTRGASSQQVVKAEIVAAPIASQPLPNVQHVTAPTSAVTLPVTLPMVTTLNTTTVTKSTTDVVFADHNSFVAFVMDAYKALGPIKGAKIQEVLTAVGVKNINDVKPEMYAQIKAGVEALAV